MSRCAVIQRLRELRTFGKFRRNSSIEPLVSKPGQTAPLPSAQRLEFLRRSAINSFSSSIVLRRVGRWWSPEKSNEPESSA
jgi:hypothetical protein